MVRLLFIAPIVAIIALPVYFLLLKGPPPLPDMDYNEWWGPDSLKAKQDTSVKPFKISFAETTIKDLKDRLKRSRSFTPPLEGVAFEYGFNSAQLDGWLKYWANEYQFKERETFLNQFPQFKTNVQGLDIHFIRVTPKVPAGVEIVPLLLLHGWPGSVREFYEAIPLITAVSKDRDFAIEVIVPSLPGYGFSDPAVRPGLGAPQVGVVMRNLMHRLGYKKFYLQGGDWGSLIGSNMVTLFPKEVLGFHTNLANTMTPLGTVLELIGSFYPPLIVDANLADRMYPLGKKYSLLIEESGYLHIQASKPDTVGVALSDSPAGLLAYILEKFSTWTRPEHRNKLDGSLTFRFTKEQLIDNLMMYWATGSITTSMRLYSENFNSKIMGLKLDEIPTPVPVWALQAKYELAYQPPCILKLKFPNLVDVTVLDDGGHFLAFELPKPFSEDVLKAIGEFRKLTKKNTKTDLTIKDLKDRLKRSRSFTPPLEGVAFEYGFNSAQLDGWLKYWANEYQFKERETFLNQFPQFKTNVQGLDIHFIRVTPKVPAGVEIVPLLLLHGWPGSVREFYEAIPLITAVSKDRDFAVEVIVASLPGYGFSDAAVRPGLGTPQIGVVMRNLMHRLGYKKFYLQGGDWGSLIGSSMVTFFPKEILGFHTNMAFTMNPLGMVLELIGSFYPSLIVDANFVDTMYPLGQKYSYLLEETGYSHIQASKPDTVGVALSDSPAGLLAYILEKFSTWTRPEHRNKLDGGLTVRFTKEQLIDNLMMYWATGSITTAMRLYSENFSSKIMGWKLDEIPTPVPVWALQAKYELAYQPPCVLKLKYPNLVGVTVLDDGGHFLAFELPKPFSEDVLKAIEEFRKLSKKNTKTDL